MIRNPAAYDAKQGLRVEHKQWVLRPGDLVPVAFDLGSLPADDPAYVIPTVLAEIFAEEAAEGAVLVEVRHGSGSQVLLRPDFMTLFRQAEQ